MEEQKLAEPKSDEAPRLVWGLENIGKVAGLNYEQTKYLVKVGALVTRKVRRRHLLTDVEVQNLRIMQRRNRSQKRGDTVGEVGGRCQGSCVRNQG